MKANLQHLITSAARVSPKTEGPGYGYTKQEARVQGLSLQEHLIEEFSIDTMLAFDEALPAYVVRCPEEFAIFIRYENQVLFELFKLYDFVDQRTGYRMASGPRREGSYQSEQGFGRALVKLIKLRRLDRSWR